MGFEFSDIGDFASNAVSTAGKVAGAGIDLVNDAAHTIGKGLDIIPVIGPLYSALWTHVTSPLDVLNRVAQGQRIDKAALDTLHSEMRVAKTVAPYAQMVMQIVPGVGPVASGAISAGIALAEGQTIDQALIEGVKGALPGGPLAKAAFNMGQSALKGENITKSLSGSLVTSAMSAAGIDLPPEAAQAIASGLNVAKGVAQGEDIKSTAINEAIANLPAASKAAASAAQAAGDSSELANILLENGQSMVPNLTPQQKDALDVAIKTGIAMGVGQYFQGALAEEMKDPRNQGLLASLGAQAAQADDAIRAAQEIIANANKPRLKAVGRVPLKEYKGLSKIGLKGFAVGTGLMQTAGLSQGKFNATRNSLDPSERTGFDTAVALHIGKVRTGARLDTPEKTAGFLVTKGMLGHSQAGKTALLRTVMSDEDGKAGAMRAAKEIQSAKTWWQKLLAFLGLS